MTSAIYQLSLVIGLGTLAVLLIRGVTLMTALQRSGLVLIIVLVLLLFAGTIIRWTVNPSQNPEFGPEAESEESTEPEDEPEQIPQ